MDKENFLQILHFVTVDITKDSFESMGQDQKFATADQWFRSREYIVKWVDGDRQNTRAGNLQYFKTLLALACLASPHNKHQNLAWENSNLMDGLPPFYQEWIQDNIALWSPE
jgi:hypothetical protein